MATASASASDSELDMEEQNEDRDETGMFALAADYVAGKSDRFSPADLLVFYAFYKQASDGPCKQPRPALLQIKARSKWTAWHDLGNMSAEEARRAYVAKLKQLMPHWKEDVSSLSLGPANSLLGHGQGSWVVHSVESLPVEDLKPDNEKNVFDYVKENDVKRLQEQLVPSDLQVLDENGMGLMHWATDRNAVDIIKYLVVRGGNINQRDGEMQTPLHYAASCGHIEALRYLLALNADMELRDSDDQTCMDVADDEQIQTMLRAEMRLRKS